MDDALSGGIDGLALRAPKHQVSSRAVWYWTVRAAPSWVVLLAAEVGLYLIVRAQLTWFVAGFAVTVLIAVAHLLVMPRWRYAVHRWEATPDAVYTQTGWFDQERRIAPASRVQTVDSERGPIERFFGLSNVTVTTASAAGPIRIHGLDHALAQQLVNDLTTSASHAQGDAT
ncbi:MAG: PH domain-containing protein [Candidatus Dormiibacterota bacterium]